MIDTIKLVRYISQEERKQLLHVFAAKTQEGPLIYYPSENKLLVNSYKNLKLLLGESSLTISGSLTKFHCGNNVQNLTYNQLLESLKSLEVLLNLTLDDSIIKRIDIGCNIELTHPVSSYLSLLFPPEGSKLIHYESETKYFEGGSKTYCIYNKTKEAKKNPNKVSTGEKLLRYELRFKKNVAKELGWSDAKLSNLYSAEHYVKLVNNFWKSFCAISYKKEFSASPLDATKIKQLWDKFIVDGIKCNGGEEVIYSLIKSPHVTRAERFAVRKKLKSLPKGKIVNWQLIDELGTKLSAKCQKEAYAAIHYTLDSPLNSDDCFYIEEEDDDLLT